MNGKTRCLTLLIIDVKNAGYQKRLSDAAPHPFGSAARKIIAACPSGVTR